MNTLARAGKWSEGRAQGVQELKQVLDQSYAKMRSEACREWQRRHPHGDPSDACVRVRIAGNGPQLLAQ
ncbi:MAG: hypothetical protein ABI787_07915 [Spartobacteria bacterium]